MSIDAWMDSLEPLNYRDLPPQKAIVVTDMVNGFCHEGPLASPRVNGLIPEITRIVELAAEAGTKLFVSIQDTHSPEALEFASFPPHCLEGTEEAQLIPELRDLGKFLKFNWQLVEKNTLNPGAKMVNGFNARLLGWTEQRSPSSSVDPHFCNVETFIVVGNCTDLCVYQTAMHIKQFFNQIDHPIIVVVPENAVQTYDIPDIHDGDFFHKTFLYHMALNGIYITKELLF